MSVMRAVHGKRDGKANRPFCSRVMKERRVVMKERAIPGPCNCCPRGPRIQYYSRDRLSSPHSKRLRHR